MDIEDKPNQPDPKYNVVQKLVKCVCFKTVGANNIHGYNSSLRGVLCFQCVKAHTVKKSTLENKADPAFSSKGFNNWKNALASLDRHQQSKSHYHAVTVNAQGKIHRRTAVKCLGNKTPRG